MSQHEFDFGQDPDFDARGKARKPRKAAPPPPPGVWVMCVSGTHHLCPADVLVQAPWATAGTVPPHPDAPPITRQRCACQCHLKN